MALPYIGLFFQLKKERIFYLRSGIELGYFKDLGNNKYRLFVEVGIDKKGKRKRKTKVVNASGIREARKLLAAFENDALNQKDELERITFSEFVQRWKQAYAIPKLSASTREVYDGILDYLLPIFNDESMVEIKTIDLVEFFAKEISEDKKQLEKKYNVMLSLFTHATKWGVIENNPMIGVDKPKLKRKKRNPYTSEELSILSSHFPSISKYHERIIKTTVECALRRGEVIALAEDVLDLENNRIMIKRSLQFTKEKGLILKSTKGEDETYIHITKGLMDELREQSDVAKQNKVRAGSSWKGFKDSDGVEVLLLFADDLGEPYLPNAVTRFWGRFIKRTGLRAISFHDLRHTSASIMIREGINPKSVQARLRHKNIHTTMDTYVHSDDSDDKVAGQTFDGIWKP